MTSAEVIPAVEKIPFLVKMAAALVPVDEYFKLSYQSSVNVHAQGAFSRGAEAINERVNQRGEGRRFNLSEPVKRTLNPKIIAARTLLKTVPLPQYLQASHEGLIAEISFNQKRMAYFEDAGVYPKELEHAWEYGMGLSQQLDLTNAVMQAVGIEPTRTVPVGV